MGYDLYGIKAKNKKGEYFRNNIWWWRPLWIFTCNVAGNLFTENNQMAGGSNSGYKIPAKKTEKLAILLKESIKDGRAKTYANLNKKNAKENKDRLSNMYPFTVKNLKEFIEFVENSGGFEIY